MERRDPEIGRMSFKAINPEFLLVDLLNNLNQLAEDRTRVLNNVKVKVLGRLQAGLKRVVNVYAGERTKCLLNAWMSKQTGR